MKKHLLILLGLAALLGSPGCATRTIEAASTQFEVTTPEGKTTRFAFPKELDAKGLDLAVDPGTGRITLKAASLKSSSQGIIESASSAQADALGKMADTLTALAPLLVPAR